jgi:hypothetical protein
MSVVTVRLLNKTTQTLKSDIIYARSLRSILKPAQLNLQLDQALDTVKVYQFGRLKGSPQLNRLLSGYTIYMSHLC